MRYIMNKKKWYKSTTLYFIVVCILAIIILALPLFLRCPGIYSIIKKYLSVFKSVEYKNTYIGTLGAIFGAFLGVTGAIWAQNIANKQSNKEILEKNARMVLMDFEIALEQVKTIVSKMWESDKMLSLPNDDAIIAHFKGCLFEHKISILPEWRQTLLSFSELLESFELRQALVVYNKLSEIEFACNVSPSKSELMSVFSKMISMIDSDNSETKNIRFIDEIDKIINQIRSVAGKDSH